MMRTVRVCVKTPRHPPLLRAAWLIPLMLMLMIAANAQQVGQNTTPNAAGGATFQTGTQLVVESVVVKDKSGKPVEGLTANDFIVTEDGVPQVIKFFEYQKFQEAAEPEPDSDGLADHL